MTEWLQKNSVSIILALVSLISTYSVMNYRVQAIEARQDRQGTTISTLQSQVGDLTSALSGLKEKIDAINDNVNYIRNRIDTATRQ